MGRAFRAAVAGILIGLFAGTLYVEMGALKRLYRTRDSVEQVMNLIEYAEDDGEISDRTSNENGTNAVGGEAISINSRNDSTSQQKRKDMVSSDIQNEKLQDELQTAFQMLDGTALNAYETQKQLQELEAMYDDIAGGSSDTGEDKEAVSVKTQGKTSDVIRIHIRYEGNEEMTDSELEQFTSFVEQAVLYEIADKLGADYNDQDKAAVRKQLNLSKEAIDAGAEESAEEYGIPVSAWSTFEYRKLPSATLNGVSYPEGYYETLCVTLR